MSRACLVFLICGCAATAALAGPNAGGTIIVHDPSWAYTDLPPSQCGLGTAPGSCADADVELDDSSPTLVKVWKVYAAFWSGSSPRLKAITFGSRLSSGTPQLW